MTPILWLLHTDHDPLPPDLLGPEEAAQIVGLAPGPRADRLRTRAAAKRLLQAHYLGQGRTLPAAAFAVLPDAQGAPWVYGRPPLCAPGASGRLPLALSLSRCEGMAVGALTAKMDAGAAPGLGIDLARVPPAGLKPEFAGLYFTPAERAGLAQTTAGARARLTIAIWSAKEAVLKALGVGLRVAPQAVECRLTPALGNGWARFSVAPGLAPGPDPSGLRGWWRPYTARTRPGAAYVLALAARSDGEVVEVGGEGS